MGKRIKSNSPALEPAVRTCTCRSAKITENLLRSLTLQDENFNDVIYFQLLPYADHYVSNLVRGGVNTA